MKVRISTILKKIQNFDEKMQVAEIVALNKEFLADLLKKQLRVGLDGNGNKVTIRGRSKYSAFTIEEKKQKSGLASVTEVITNYDTGDFYRGITPYTDGKRLFFDSSVPYFDEIVKQSGGIIMKLNKSNLELFIKTKLRPELIRRMKNGL
jgi:hypothetical protein